MYNNIMYTKYFLINDAVHRTRIRNNIHHDTLETYRFRIRCNIL